MKTLNSNIKTRKKAKGKAIFFVLFPMIFAAMGTSLINNVDGVDAKLIGQLESEIAAIKEDRTQFLGSMQVIDSVWNRYQETQKKALGMEDSLSQGKIALQIGRQERVLNTQLYQLEASLRDTVINAVYITAIKNYDELIKNYMHQVKDKKSLRDYEACVAGGADMAERIDELENENMDLREDYLRCLGGGASCSMLQIELNRSVNELQRCNQQLSREQEKYEKLKKAKKRLEESFTTLCSQTVIAIKNLPLKGGIGCNKSDIETLIQEISRDIDETVRAIKNGE